MNAALEQVLSLGKVRKRSGAALNDSSLCDGNIGETTRAFRNDCLPVIESIDEASSKLFDFSEGMGLAALIGHQYRSSLLYVELVRFEIPARIGCSGRSRECLGLSRLSAMHSRASGDASA